MFKSKKILLSCLILSSVIAFSGCASLDRAVSVPAPAPVTELSTNALGQVFTSTYTPLQINPALLPYYQTADAIVPLLPTPAREVAGGVAGALAGALVLYLRTRNKIKSAQNRTIATEEHLDAVVSDKDRIDAALRSAIAAVERTGDAEVKAAIKKQAEKDDTQQTLRTIVREVTG